MTKEQFDLQADLLQCAIGLVSAAHLLLAIWGWERRGWTWRRRWAGWDPEARERARVLAPGVVIFLSLPLFLVWPSTHRIFVVLAFVQFVVMVRWARKQKRAREAVGEGVTGRGE